MLDRPRSGRCVALAVLVLGATGPGVARGADLSRLLRREQSLLGALSELSARAVRGAARIRQLEREQRTLGYELAEAARRIDALQRRARARRATLAKRLRAVYRLTRGGYLRFIVEAKGERELLWRSGALRRILRRDLGELKLYRRELAGLREQRAQLREQRARQAALLDRLHREQKKLIDARCARRQLLGRVARSRRLEMKLSGELSAGQQRLLARIARLQRTVRRAGGFAARRGRLHPPVHGRVVGVFGRALDRKSGLAVARSGLTFRTSGKARVRAVAAGRVRVARELAGYGKVVLLEHEGGYYTLYGFLSRVAVRSGDRVQRRGTIGRAGFDPLAARPGLYFEIRHGKRPLDPAAWLRRR